MELQLFKIQAFKFAAWSRYRLLKTMCVQIGKVKESMKNARL
jgi:hypothetical protein